MIRPVLILGFLLASGASALAHHGFGTFDMSKSVTLSGRLTKVEFINPHSWLYFEVTDENGRVSLHRCEMRSAHTLRRSGWSRELFPIGEQVTIDASPDRKDPNSCYLNTIRFQNGSHMDRYGQYVKGDGGIQEVRGPVKDVKSARRAVRRPTGEWDLSGDWAPEQVVMADPRGRGGRLIPLSQLPEDPAAAAQQQAGGGGGRRGGGPGTGPRLYGGTELTPVGQRAAERFTQADNPRFKCETTSILFDWTFDGPVNRITQSPDRIVIRYGQMGLRRTIHLNMKEHPAKITPSRAGHSIGWWEGDTLVVDTIGFLPGVLNAPVRHSDRLHVVERFTLDPETMQLRRTYEAEDPVYLKGKYTGSDVVQPADAPYTEDNCNELGFIDFSEQQSSR